VPDSCFVPLGGTLDRLLPAPAVLVEDAAHLGGVVLDPEMAADNLGYPGLGPDVAAKAESLGSLGQEIQHLEPLLVGQLGPTAWGLAVAQGLGPFGPGPAEPLADGSFGHAQGFGDAVLGPTFLGQFPGPQAASFPPVGCLLGTLCCHTFQYAKAPTQCLTLFSSISKRVSEKSSHPGLASLRSMSRIIPQ
jgi:hypothetical protein